MIDTTAIEQAKLGQTPQQVTRNSPPISGLTANDIISNTEQKLNQAPIASPYSSTVSTTVDASRLGQTTPLKIAPKTTSTAAAGLMGAVDAVTAQAQDNIKGLVDQTAITEGKEVNKTLFNRITDFLNKKQGETSLTDAAYKDTVDPAKQELTEITNQINAKQLAFRREAEAAAKAIGGTVGGNNLKVQAIERRAASELADLSVIQQAKSNNYANAKEIADRKVAMELEEQRNEFEALQFFYTENKEELNKNEQRQFELLISERGRLLEQQENEKRAINDIALIALQNGASQSVAQKILSSKDQASALVAGAGYYRDPLEDRYKRMQIEKLQQEIDSVNDIEDLNTAINQLVSDADPVSSKAALSALLGSGKISAGTKGRIAPAIGVLNSVDEFANNNVEGAFTGLGIGGRIKEGIKGLFNMKDPEAVNNAQQIEAINLNVQNWASGAALTTEQTKQVARLTPTKYDTDKTIRAKLNGLYNFMLNRAEADLLTEGVNVQFQPVNLFEIMDLYKEASPEQKKIIEETYFNK